MSCTPRVWVGCLGCYSEGYLAGMWFDAADAPTSMAGEDGDTENCKAGQGTAGHGNTGDGNAGCWNARVDERATPLSPHHFNLAHEELWVMDHEHFGPWLTGECHPATARYIAKLLAAIEEDSYNVEVVGAWVSHESLTVSGKKWDELREDFLEAWVGEFADLADYAEQSFEGYQEQLDALPDEIRLSIDWGAIGRSRENGGEIYSVQFDDKIHVFHNA